MISRAYALLVVSHAVVPWLVVARRFFPQRKLPPPPEEPAKSDAEKNEKNEKKKKKKKNETAVAEHHAHRCEACGAPVPLAADTFACPHCRAKVVPPPDVARAYRRLAWAERALVRAERAWKRAVLWNAPVWQLLFGLLYGAWSIALFAVLYGPNDFAAWPRLNGALRLAAVANAGMVGWWLGPALALNAYQLPKVLGNVPRRVFQSLPAQQTTCSSCGADVELAEGRLATLCTYCGSEEIRPSLAPSAAREARALGGAAKRSIVDAYRSVIERRETLLIFFDLVAGLQVCFALDAVARLLPFIGPWLDKYY